MAVSLRHTLCSLQKRELWYEDIRASVGGSDFNPLAASGSFLSFVDQHGHGAVVLPLNAVGKGRRQPLPTVRVGAEVRGLEWDPFGPQNLATAGTDGLVKLWAIPPGGLQEDLTAPMVSMNTSAGASDGVPEAQSVPKGLAFHPCAPGLIAARGLRKLSMFDMCRPQTPILSIGGDEVFTGDTYDMQWNHYGDVLLTTDATRTLKLIDIRLLSFDYATGTITPISSSPVGGVARAYAFVPRSSCDVMSCEVTRLLKLCDDMVQPVMIQVPRRDKLKFHQELYPPAPGGHPSIDAQSWLMGGNQPPYLEALGPPEPGAQVRWNQPPPTPSNATNVSTAAQPAEAPAAPPHTADKVNSLSSGSDPGRASSPRSQEVARDVPILPASPDVVIPPAEPSGGATLASGGAGDEGRASSGDKDVIGSASTNGNSSKSQQWRAGPPKIKLRHVFGAETRGAKPVFNLSPLLVSLDGSILAASSSFWAIPWVGGGGPVYVSPISATGKVEPDCDLVNGHRATVNSIGFSPSKASLMATGSEDSTIKLWSLPDGGVKEGGMGADDALADLTFNSTAVRHVEFNPVAENVLMSTNADHSLRLCDVAAGGDAAISTIDVHTNTINSACFSGDGSLIATTCRDGNIRILDPRAGSEVAKGRGHGGRKTMKAVWCPRAGAQEVLATTGCASAGQRQLCLWDPRDLSTPYATKTVDSSNGLLYPIFSEATGLLLLASRGGSGIKYFELSETGCGDDSDGASLPRLHVCHEYKAAGEPCSGVALLPPSCLDVAGVEVARLLRLTPTTMEPVSFLLPRSGDLKNFFQDDIYRPVRSREPCLSSAEWRQGANPGDAERRSHESLCPRGMQPLSERPAPKETGVPKAVIFRQEMEQRQKEEEAAANTMAKMAELANQNAQFNPNRSVGVVMGVDQPTIVDSDSGGEWSD